MRNQYKILAEIYEAVGSDTEEEAEKILAYIKTLPDADLFIKEFSDTLEDFYIDKRTSKEISIIENKILTYLEVKIENIYYDLLPHGKNIQEAAKQTLLDFEKNEYGKWYKVKQVRDELYKDNPGVNIDI